MSKNKDKNLSEEDIYNFYKIIFEASFGFRKKCHLFDALCRGESCTWKVIGVSKQALQELANKNFIDTKGIQRHHHTISRNDTYKKMFCSTLSEMTPLSYKTWLEIFRQGNEVVLVTKKQNDKPNIGNNDVIKVDIKRALFVNRTVGFRYSKAEREYLRFLHTGQL